MTLFNDGGFRAVGYTNVAFLDIITNVNKPHNINMKKSLILYKPLQTWTVPSPQINAPTIFSAVQSSIYYPKDQKIYYFGGTYGDTLLPGYKTTTTGTAHNFTYALTFDTSKSVWENQTLSGPNPAPRKFHTTNICKCQQVQYLLFFLFYFLLQCQTVPQQFYYTVEKSQLVRYSLIYLFFFSNISY